MASNNPGNKQSGNQGSGSGTSNRGFASMDPQRQREIASEGGKAAHEKGTAHEFTSEEARRAGSMSHGNRQSDESSARSSKQGGSKQSGQAGSRSGRSNASDEIEGAEEEQGSRGNRSGAGKSTR